LYTSVVALGVGLDYAGPMSTNNQIEVGHLLADDMYKRLGELATPIQPGPAVSPGMQVAFWAARAEYEARCSALNRMLGAVEQTLRVAGEDDPNYIDRLTMGLHLELPDALGWMIFPDAYTSELSAMEAKCAAARAEECQWVLTRKLEIEQEGGF
jgi:hypothetical protein